MGTCQLFKMINVPGKIPSRHVLWQSQISRPSVMEAFGSGDMLKCQTKTLGADLGDINGEPQQLLNT